MQIGLFEKKKKIHDKICIICHQNPEHQDIRMMNVKKYSYLI